MRGWGRVRKGKHYKVVNPATAGSFRHACACHLPPGGRHHPLRHACACHLSQRARQFAAGRRAGACSRRTNENKSTPLARLHKDGFYLSPFTVYSVLPTGRREQAPALRYRTFSLRREPKLHLTAGASPPPTIRNYLTSSQTKLHCGASRRHAPPLSPCRILFDEDGDLDPVLDLALLTVGFHPRLAHDMERAVEGIVEETQISYGTFDRFFSTAPRPF